MADFECRIDGLDRLEQVLEQLAPREAKLALRRAAKAGMKIVQEAIEEHAPRDTGHLAESINIGSEVGGGDGDDATGSIAVKVGPAGDAYYALFQEFGTRFQQAQPFMTPAYEENKDAVIETCVTELQTQLNNLAE
jgi:HK97 gp10 family phage protein